MDPTPSLGRYVEQRRLEKRARQIDFVIGALRRRQIAAPPAIRAGVEKSIAEFTTELDEVERHLADLQHDGSLSALTAVRSGRAELAR